MAPDAFTSLSSKCLRKGEGGSEVDAEHLLPISQQEIQGRDDYLVTRRVYQDVETSERLACPLNGRGGLPGIPEIDGAAYRTYPERLCFCANRLDLVGRAGYHRDVCSSTSKSKSNRAANAPPCSADQGVPSVEIPHDR